MFAPETTNAFSYGEHANITRLPEYRGGGGRRAASHGMGRPIDQERFPYLART
jgi:hypothetical protein